MQVPVIKRNTQYPAMGKQVFHTGEDNVTSLIFRVFEGKAGGTEADGKHMHTFLVTDLRPLPRGQAKVEVTFSMAKNEGTLQVSYKDITPGCESELHSAFPNA